MADNAQSIQMQTQSFNALLSGVFAEAVANPKAGKLKSWAENFANVEGKNADKAIAEIAQYEANLGKSEADRAAALNALGKFVATYGLNDAMKDQGTKLAEVTQVDEAKRKPAREKHKDLTVVVDKLAKTQPVPAPAAAAKQDAKPDAKADANKPADPKVAQAKARIEAITKEIEALKKGAKTDADKQKFAALVQERSELRPVADESQVMGFFTDMMDKFSMGDFNMGSLIGGALGLGGAFMLGGIFGEGMLGTILKIALAPLLMFMGANLMSGLFGGSSSATPNAPAAGQSASISAPGKGLQLSLEGLDSVRDQMPAKNASQAFYLLRPVQGSQEWRIVPIGKDVPLPNDQYLVSYNQLRTYISQHGGSDGKTVVNIDMQKVAALTRWEMGDASRQQARQAAAPVVGQVQATAPAATGQAAAAGSDRGFWDTIKERISQPQVHSGGFSEADGHLPGTPGYPGGVNNARPAATR